MATPQPQGHLLIVSDCMWRPPVRILVAAARFTRCSPEFNPSPIMKGATPLQLRHLRTGILLYMMNDTILGQKVHPITLRALLVTCVFDFKISSLISSFVESICRYPRCGQHAFFDRRVNELREWCSDQHMQCVVPIYHQSPVLSYLSLGLQ